MTRSLHGWLGLVLALLLSVLALSGAALALFPVAERWAAGATDGMSAAQLVATVATAHPGLEEIAQSPGGQVTAWFPEAGKTVAAVVDPQTGATLAPATPSATLRWLENLHRSLFLGDGGRLTVAGGAAAMLVLSATGLLLLARRSGGWRAVFAPLRGAGAGRWHSELARVAVAGLILSSITGLWMTAATFDLLPTTPPPVFPAAVSGMTDFPVTRIPQLTGAAASDLRDLVLPQAGDPTDVYTLTTVAGQGYIDQGTGKTLVWVDASLLDRASVLIQTLHTGRGAAMLGVLLGLSALAVPALGISGALQRRRRADRGPDAKVTAAQADTIILVGSEGGSTWGFAETLRAALQTRGNLAHLAALSDFAPDQWTRARCCIILTSTYGSGSAPSSADGFLAKLKAMRLAPKVPVAIVGFGDSSFPEFCGYADQVGQAAGELGWQMLLPLARVDRQDVQDFARWGRDLAAVMGLSFELSHVAAIPATRGLTLTERCDYGEAIQVPSAILRFALPRPTLWQRLAGRSFPPFKAGDLLGVVPEGAAVPRFYSLASSSADGFVEICVRKRPGGLCSGQLIALQPGDRIQAFVRQNPTFHPDTADTPLILVGAGTGVGPLAGFVRANDRRRPVHLFFGMRHADHDFLYREDFAAWQTDGRLAGLDLAFSHGPRPHYVQDALRREAATLRQLIGQGARIMVCGGREMAAGVKSALEDILRPIGLTPIQLAGEDRYVEDVY